MERSFSLQMDTESPDQVRAELVESKPNGKTVISVSITLSNQIAHQTLAAVQAEVVRLAIADLQALHARLLATPS